MHDFKIMGCMIFNKLNFVEKKDGKELSSGESHKSKAMFQFKVAYKLYFQRIDAGLINSLSKQS